MRFRHSRRGGNNDGGAIAARHPELGVWNLECGGSPELLFTDNETNNRRLFGSENPSRFVKDGINDFLLHGRADAINPAAIGTKAAAHYRLEIAAGGSASVRLRLRPAAATGAAFGDSFNRTFERRRAEVDAFYQALSPANLDEDGRRIFRQALAGMFVEQAALPLRRSALAGAAWRLALFRRAAPDRAQR